MFLFKRKYFFDYIISWYYHGSLEFILKPILSFGADLEWTCKLSQKITYNFLSFQFNLYECIGNLLSVAHVSQKVMPGTIQFLYKLCHLDIKSFRTISFILFYWAQLLNYIDNTQYCQWNTILHINLLLFTIYTMCFSNYMCYSNLLKRYYI